MLEGVPMRQALWSNFVMVCQPQVQYDRAALCLQCARAHLWTVLATKKGEDVENEEGHAPALECLQRGEALCQGGRDRCVDSQKRPHMAQSLLVCLFLW